MIKLFSCILLFTLIIFSYASCPPRAFQSAISSTCYSFYGQPLDFFSAETTCNELGGHLTSIPDGFENAFIAEELRKLVPDIKNTWIGAEYVGESWKWLDGSLFVFSNWGNGEPSTKGKYCATITPQDSNWVTADCKTKLPFMCKVASATSTCPTVPALNCPTTIPSKCPTTIPATCPSNIKPLCESGWTWYDYTNSCYKVIYNKDFTTAENFCVSVNSHLASIHSVLEDHFLMDLIKVGYDVTSGSYGFEAHIGLKYNSNIGDFQWTDGTNVDYLNWGSGTLGDGNGQQCAGLVGDPIYGFPQLYQHWEAIPCTAKIATSICKKSANSH